MAEQVYWDDVKKATKSRSSSRTAARSSSCMWAAGSGDFYQIHYDERFAKSNQLKDIIVHGALKSAFLGQLPARLGRREGRASRSYGLLPRHGLPEPGDHLQGVVTKKYEEDGEHVVELDIWTETGAADDGDDRTRSRDDGTASCCLRGRPRRGQRHKSPCRCAA